MGNGSLCMVCVSMAAGLWSKIRCAPTTIPRTGRVQYSGVSDRT